MTGGVSGTRGWVYLFEKYRESFEWIIVYANLRDSELVGGLPGWVGSSPGHLGTFIFS